ncbi:restriction endonuclease subunit S [Gemmiger formicilis]|uniref:restriction endonuclease subunit S n=1 Tax=Gemmiger formicilis TaxID=745368 RepID=UPI001959D726|nr:restriction endonuclease subunit S [Gemmiger formicilis]MBM6899862.1 restriction endonuclease subunit S [Gemmiger formicilis]
MALTKYTLGELLVRNAENNENLQYGVSDVRGVLNTKGISNTKADLNGRDLKKFLVVRPGGFVFNHRVHDKLGLGYNTTEETYIFTNDYVAFYVKSKVKETILLPEYLYIWFLRPEFDRYMLFKTYGSATLFFSWDNMCELEIELPDITIQREFVNIYKSMVANQKSYENGLEDLKLLCDGYIEDLRRKMPCKKIGPYLKESNQRNDAGLEVDAVRGLSTTKEMIPTKADMSGVSLSNYKVVEPRQIAYVPDTSRRGDKISLGFNNTSEPFLVSSISIVFGTNLDFLIPEYLMLFLTRPEFDRYARFNSWGSARETFDWSEMQNIQIPIPDIKIQKAIAEIFTVYNTRKRINEQLKAQIKDICPILIRGSWEEGKAK